MDGLDINEVRLSETKQNKDYRIDSNFYTTYITRNPNVEYVPIGKCLLESQYGVSKDMNESGIGYPIYRMNEIHNMLCDTNPSKSVVLDNAEFVKFKLNNRDVLFNRTNSYEYVGRTGVYYDDGTERTFASYLVRFVPNNNYILPEYLTAFLNTKYGRADIKRRARQSINQTNVNPEEVKEIQIPLFSFGLQNTVYNCFVEANTKRNLAQKCYEEAEEILLMELGVKDFALTEKNINVRNLSKSFGETGRLDAEYYQPKYEFYEAKIKNYCGGYNKLGDICKYIFTGEYADEYLRKSKNLQFYIRGTNMKNGRIEKDDNYYVHPDCFTKKVCSGDIVTTRVGTIGTFAEIDDNLDGAIYSDNVICFRMPDECRADVYTLLFNSKPMYELIDRLARGSVQQRLNQETLRQIIVPMLDLDLQQKISEMIKSSFEFHNKSRLLLDCAVQAVEMAIEQSEEKATALLNEKVKEIESL